MIQNVHKGVFEFILSDLILSNEDVHIIEANIILPFPIPSLKKKNVNTLYADFKFVFYFNKILKGFYCESQMTTSTRNDQYRRL